MKPCEWVRERLFGQDAEGAEAAECREHIASCPACAAELELLGHLSTALRADEAFPREHEVDWMAFRRETVERAMGRRAPARQWMPAWLSSPRLAWGSAAALVAAGGIALMMMLPATQPPVDDVVAQAPFTMNEGNIDNLTVNLARQNTERYLNETRAVLVTLLDVGIDCDKDKVDVSAERAKATALLRRQRLIAAELNRVPLARAQDVCNELERLLVEISTLADCARDSDLQTLRDVVEKRQILVRMELLSAELARREASRA